jgi:hypothetical protein
MDAQARRELSLIIAFLVAVAALGAVADLRAGTPPAVLATRLALTGLLCWALWRGHGWARWVTAVLALGGACFLLLLAWTSGGATLFTLLVTVSAIAHVVVGIGLVRSRAIKAYVDARAAARRTPAPG